MEQGRDFRLIPADWVADPLYWLAEDGRVVHANEAGCQVLGYRLDELTALHVWDIDLHLSREGWLARDDAAFVAEGLRTVSRRKDGSTFPGEVRGRPVQLDETCYYICTVRDISAYVKLEKEALDAERAVRTILDHIPDIAWMKDTESRFVAINQASVETCGIGAAEAVGKTDFDLFPAHIAAGYRADDVAVIASGERKCVEEPFIGVDGLPRWIETIKTPIRDSEGRIVGTVGIARDISARKIVETGEREVRAMLEARVDERTCALREEIAAREAADAALVEQKMLLETIIDAATAVIFVKDRDGRYLLVNRRYLALGNWRREDVIGKTDFDLYPRDLAEHLGANDRAVLEGAAPVEFEETVESLKGERTYIALKVPLMLPSGEPFAVCGIATDITERKQAQALLRETNCQLEARVRERTAALEQATLAAERANQAKSRFLAATSHDLRQPFQAMALFLDVLEARLSNPDNRRVLASLSNAITAGHDLLNALLDISTLEAGITVPKFDAVPLGRMLEALAEEFRDQAARQGLSFRFVPCSANLNTDNVLFTRIVRNLLTNALRYTHSGKVLFGCRKAGGHIRIEVWDTGPGILPEKQSEIWEEFTQLNNPERDRAKGLGLGLAIVARTSKLLDHPIGLHSHVGKGSVFFIEVPLAGCVPEPGFVANGDLPSASSLVSPLTNLSAQA